MKLGPGLPPVKYGRAMNAKNVCLSSDEHYSFINPKLFNETVIINIQLSLNSELT